MILADTSAIYALFVRTDPHHGAAEKWYSANRSEQLLVTDHIVEETLTLLRAHGHNRRAIEIGGWLLEAHRLAQLHRISDFEYMEAWAIFRDYADKEWSFTDCASYAVMKTLKIDTAFSFDRHFQQFGFVSVVP